MQLITPSPEYLPSYYEACVGTWPTLDPFLSHLLHDPAKYGQWKETIFADYADAKAGRNLPQGWAPYETLWLVDGSEYVGTAIIRFPKPGEVLACGDSGFLIRRRRRGTTATREMLVLIFERMRAMGKKHCVVSCRDSDEKNVAFERRITPIEKETTVEIEYHGGKVLVRQFWRDIDKLDILKKYGHSGK